MYLDKNAILESLTPDDIITVLADLGSPTYRKDKRSDALIFKTVCHGGNKYKLYYYHEGTDKYPPRLFHCYTDCSDSFDIIQLVLRAKRTQGYTFTFYQALRYIAQLTGKMFGIDQVTEKDNVPKNTTLTDLAILKKIERISAKTPNAVIDLPEINEHILELFCYLPHETWLEEGISEETMNEFEISYWSKCDCIILPVRDYQGRLIGIRCRNLNPDLIEHYAKYCPIVVENKVLSYPTTQTFYGICQNIATIKRMKKVILYEGEKSVLLNHTYFPDHDFSLAVCGSTLSQEHIYILLRLLEVTEVIIAFDREYHDPHSYEAEVYLQKLLLKVQPLVPYCKVTLLLDVEGWLDYKDSPVDKGKEVLLKLLDDKMVVTQELIDESLSKRKED